MNFFKKLFLWKRPLLHCPEKLWCQCLIILNVTLASMMVIMDLLAQIPTLSEMQGYFAIDSTKVMFIPRLYMFMLGVMPLCSVRLGKLMGYKRLLLLGLFTFLIGSIGSAYAPNYWFVLFFRIIGGAGGGMIISCGFPVINHTVSKSIRRIIVAAYSSTFFGLGIAFGLILGGYYGQMQNWKMIYLSNGYFSAIVFFLLLFFHAETEKEDTTTFDWAGFLSICCFCFSIFLFVTQVKEPWNTLGFRSPFAHYTIASAIVSLSYFIFHSLRAPYPLFNLRLFAWRPFTLGCIGMMVVGFMVFGITMASTFLLEEIYTYQRWQLGLFMSIIGFTYFFAGGITSILIRWISPRFFVLIGLFLIVVSCYIAQTITIQSDQFQLGFVMVLRSIGVAFVLGPITVLSSSYFSQEMYPKGVSIITFIRQMSGVLGSGIIGMIASIRFPYHSLVFGEQVDIYSPAFQEFITQFTQRTAQMQGSGLYLGTKQATLLTINYINMQANISAHLDAEYIMGVITLTILCIYIIAIGSDLWSFKVKKYLVKRKKQIPTSSF